MISLLCSCSQLLTITVSGENAINDIGLTSAPNNAHLYHILYSRVRRPFNGHSMARWRYDNTWYFCYSIYKTNEIEVIDQVFNSLSTKWWIDWSWFTMFCYRLCKYTINWYQYSLILVIYAAESLGRGLLCTMSSQCWKVSHEISSIFKSKRTRDAFWRK